MSGCLGLPDSVVRCREDRDECGRRQGRKRHHWWLISHQWWRQRIRPGRRIRNPCQPCVVREPSPSISSILPPPRLLAAARVLVGITQRELATEAGLDRSLIARYEAGLSLLRADSFGAILVVLRNYGVHFVEESEKVEMGVQLVRDRKIWEALGPKTRRASAPKGGA
jgi:hypothetical protein